MVMAIDTAGLDFRTVIYIRLGIVDFGLGADSVIERLTVFWPDGSKQDFAGVAADQRVIVVEGQKQVSTQR